MSNKPLISLVILALTLLFTSGVFANTYQMADNTMYKDVQQVKVHFSGNITQKKSAAFMSVLDEINQRYVNAKDLTISFSSDGGDMDAALSMYYAIKSSQIPVTTVNLSAVVSAATIPFCAAEKREVADNAVFIIHPAQMDKLDEHDVTPAKIRTSQDFISTYNSLFRRIYAKCSNLTSEELNRPLDSDGDRLYLSAKEALSRHLATAQISKLPVAPVSYYVTDD